MAKHVKRPIRIEGDIAYVPLTKGYEAIIDIADIPLVDGVNWTASINPKTVYAYRKGVGGINIVLHRLIMDATSHVEVDHIDGNGLNCRRCNLRIASHAENMRNRRLSRDNTSGVKGASLDRSTGKWQANIRKDGRQFNLGRFNCRTAAAIAYAKASRDLHGEFGRTA